MSNRLCGSFCEGFCGMDFDPDDLDEDGFSVGQPSSATDEGLCLDDGERLGGCDEFFVDGDEDFDPNWCLKCHSNVNCGECPH